ncbi:LOB domain-containing protein 38-like isoform X3 [Rhododendron vialii]|uniref:LOB domain-containing protein 38-like isoform X3 n=1 Tax=Rhododendron vialii TaxID=182163 RepID=UPI00265E0ADA|nr:LOB domain-containing protein 38-like isoform X3 [Rhododendron vialii]
MSCNGCRVLREGCTENCILRQSLHGIESHQAQANATIFVAKFFGLAGLMSLLSSVPESQRPALFQSLLFEACGRTVNPVNGAVGLLWTGNWHVCQSAAETVLGGGALLPISKSPAEESDHASGGGALLPISKSPAKESDGASSTNNIDLFGYQDHLDFSHRQNNRQELAAARQDPAADPHQSKKQDFSAMNMKLAGGTATQPVEVEVEVPALISELLPRMTLGSGSAQNLRAFESEVPCRRTSWEERYFCGIRFTSRKKTYPSTTKMTSYRYV